MCDLLWSDPEGEGRWGSGSQALPLVWRETKGVLRLKQEPRKEGQYVWGRVEQAGVVCAYPTHWLAPSEQERG